MEIEKEIECKEHSDEVVRFYCETCETAICILCTFNDHKDHEVAQFSDAVQKYKSNIENLLGNCQNKLENFNKQIDNIGKCEAYIRAAEQKVRDVTIDMIAEIRNREKLLIEEIHNLYGEDMMSLIGKKSEYQTEYDTFKGTVQLTELVLKGKDMELLLLKKEVQNKLEALSTRTIDNLPPTSERAVKFIPGMVDMGYIHDSESESISRHRRYFNREAADNQEDGGLKNSDAQTDGPERESVGVNTAIVCRVDEDTQTDLPTGRQESLTVIHEPLAAVSGRSYEPEPGRYVIHQNSLDEDSSARSRRSRSQTSNEEDAATLRRRRRRERAKTQRIDPTSDRYSYPSDTTPSGLYEAHYSSYTNLSSTSEQPEVQHRHRMRRYATLDD